jgi:4-amino-4-deoxy-L-arabinose transferase-like glycosyltransferase
MGSSLARAIAASCLFLLLSAIMIPYAGIQDDEALFTTPLYLHISKEFRVRILHHDVFLMVMSYMGTLKTVILAPIFFFWGVNRWSLRLPVAVIGAATVFVFYFLAERAAGRWAACLAAFLLATDPVFLLTNTFDWGPVAIEHVLLVTACWSLLAFSRDSVTGYPHLGRNSLILGFLCLGLALWNKAIFVWALAGLSVAVVVVFPSTVRHLLTRRRIWPALAALVIGALPLVIYNARHRNATLSGNAHLDLHGMAPKWIQVANAASGSSLFVYLVSEEWMPQPKPAVTWPGRIAVSIRRHMGEHRQTGFYYVFGVLLAAVPLWWRSKTARFALVFLAVTWLAMALTRDAGGSAHHVILLWPFPVLFAAAALAGLANLPGGRWIAPALGMAMILMNLVVLNQYLVQFERNGPGAVFTDAVFPLSEQLEPLAGRPVYVVDWGMLNVLAFLHQGHLDLRVGSEPLMTDAPSVPQQRELGAMIINRSAVFVGHTAGEEIFPQVNERLDRAAASLGYRKDVLRTIPDSNGRPRFEIFSFRPVVGGPNGQTGP